jgi:hypothetical protein
MLNRLFCSRFRTAEFVAEHSYESFIGAMAERFRVGRGTFWIGRAVSKPVASGKNANVTGLDPLQAQRVLWRYSHDDRFAGDELSRRPRIRLWRKLLNGLWNTGGIIWESYIRQSRKVLFWAVHKSSMQFAWESFVRWIQF